MVLVRRGGAGRPVGSVVVLDRGLKPAEFDRAAALAPADIVFVPRSGIAKVNLFVEQVFKNNIPVPIVISFYPLN